MKRSVLLSAAMLMATLAVNAASPKEEVIAAAKKLGEQANYSWKTTTSVPQGSQFRPGPVEGKADKEGNLLITMEVRDNLIEAVLNGDKGAMTNQDGDWQSLSEIENSEGNGRFRAMMLRNMKAPAVQAADLANGARELKKDGDVISGELTEEGAKQFMRFGRGGQGPTVSKAGGTVKFWLKDGAVAKYEYTVKGAVNFNGEDRDVDRTSTTEVMKIDETKLVIPEAAKKKLS